MFLSSEVVSSRPQNSPRKYCEKTIGAVLYFSNFKWEGNAPIVYSGWIQWSLCSTEQSSGVSRGWWLSQQMGAGLVCREPAGGLQASPLERSPFAERPLHPGSKLQQQSITSLRAFSPSVTRLPLIAAVITLHFIQCHLVIHTYPVYRFLVLCLGRHH